MDPTANSPASYYNNYKKRSFFLSRLTVMGSMIVLIITLVVNIALLYSNDKNTLQSHAATPQNPEKLLPSLPAGCEYRAIKGGEAVFCPQLTPTPTVTVPLDITLPQLPSQCHLVTSTTNGSEIQCTLAVPIPTVAVTLPTSCEVGNQSNSITCKNTANENVEVQLPSLPEGCSYELNAKNYYIVCEAK